MWKYRFLFFTVLLLGSCRSTYTIADKYSGLILKRNGLRHHSLDLEKYRLSYWDSGKEKPVLLLIHGFATSGQFQWFKESSVLSRRYRLIIIDLLYFGSEPKTPVYTVNGQVNALRQLVEKLNISSFYLCGTSYGGVVAAQYTLTYPKEVKKLILMDTPLKFFTEKDVEDVCESYNIKDPRELYVPSSPEMFKKLIRITYLKTRPMPMPMTRSFYAHTYGEKLADLRGLYRNFMEESEGFKRQEYQFKMPVLLIWGKEDRLVPLRVGRELLCHIGLNAQLEVVPNAAHLPNLENEQVVNKLILSFLKEK